MTGEEVGADKQCEDCRIDCLYGWWILEAFIGLEWGATDIIVAEADSEDANDNPA